MKVVILGAGGMLGHMVSRVLKGAVKEILPLDREFFDARPRALNQVGGALSIACGLDTDFVINCIGAIKPTFNDALEITGALYINALFPHQLATWGELTKTNIIHITTDCVFDGKKGPYTEDDRHTAFDNYGMSKSLGEPPHCMVLRTSIIGPEINGRSKSLLEWIKGQGGQTINGYYNHKWNGVTTLELGHILSDIVNCHLYSKGTFHIYSSDVTKYEMLKKIVKVYGLDVKVERFKAPEPCDRRLSTVKDLNKEVCPHSFDEMIKEMSEHV